jgi:hypothetical protein
MDEPRKIPPRQVDALADRLQTSLERRRPRAWMVVVAVLAIAAIGAAIVWWQFGGGHPPQLEVIAFDTVFSPGETPRVAAEFAFPDAGPYSPSLLGGKEALFFDAAALLRTGGGPPEPRAKATSDPQGYAAVDWPDTPPAAPMQIQARYVDLRHKQGNYDRAQLVPWSRERPTLLIDVEEALAAVEPAQWETTNPLEIGTQPGAGAVLQAAKKKGYQIGYLTVVADPLRYRKVRSWVQRQQTVAGGFPEGPVLGRLRYEARFDVNRARYDRVHDVRSRFGDNITLIVHSKGAAEANVRNAIRIIVVGEPVDLPNVVHAAGWDEVTPLLDSPPKKE